MKPEGEKTGKQASDQMEGSKPSSGNDDEIDEQQESLKMREFA